MATISYQQMPVSVAAQTIYASTVSISQDISPESISSIGVKGSNGTYNKQVPQGQVSFSYYENGSFSTFEGLAKSYSPQTVVVGPFTLPLAYLTSLSFNGEPNQPIQIDQSWNFYGELTEGSPPATTVETIDTYSISALDNYEGGQAFNISYGLSQNYETKYYLAQVNPVVIWRDGQVTLEIEGDDLTSALTESSTSVCLPSSNAISVTMAKSCDAATTTTIAVAGKMSSRSLDNSAGDIVRTNLSVLKYL